MILENVLRFMGCKGFFDFQNAKKFTDNHDTYEEHTFKHNESTNDLNETLNEFIEGDGFCMDVIGNDCDVSLRLGFYNDEYEHQNIIDITLRDHKEIECLGKHLLSMAHLIKSANNE